MTSIKVAVRVRPFSEREIASGANLCISMKENVTTVINPEDKSKSKSFTYDYSYWSHDGFKILENGYLAPDNSDYADQEKIFNELGLELLDNAWEGYNTTLFAYGQTGSGKSYSIVGYDKNEGIFTRVCKSLFERIDSNKDKAISYEVVVSMMEIYNERVHDLLISPRKRNPGGLSIRRSPHTGTFIQDLSKHKVESFNQIKEILEEGNNNRTIGATVMNLTSSRAHTLLTILLKQVQFDETLKAKVEKVSNICLVDLAGSERTGAMGATDIRLREGTLINKSLYTLGNIFTLLAEKANGKLPASKVIPYRDSALTKVLQDPLEGNSKTLMIASISPSFENYSETLSTLRYADSVKHIKTHAVVNKNKSENLIQDLKAEIERLKECIRLNEVKGNDQAQRGAEDTENYEQELEESTAALAEMSKNWKNAAQKFQNTSSSALKNLNLESKQDKLPRIKNINEDPFLCGKLVYLINEGINIIGRENATDDPDILIGGAGIQKKHAKLTFEKSNSENDASYNKCYIEAYAKTVINGHELAPEKPRALMNRDRILFGNHNLFVFYESKATEGPLPDWDEAMQEASKKYLGQVKNVSKEDETRSLKLNSDDAEKVAKRLLQQVMTRAIVLIEEVNLIAEEMGKPILFSLKLATRTNNINSTLKDGISKYAIQNTQIMICNHRLDKDIIQFWPLELFEQQVFEIREVFNKWSNKKQSEELAIADDPFLTVPDSYYLIGNCYIFSDFMRNLVSFKKEKFPILDYKGKKEGELTISMEISLFPVENSENLYPLEDSEVSNYQYNESIDDFNSVEDLIGRVLNVKLEIIEANLLRYDYLRNIKIAYKWVDGTSEFEVNSNFGNTRNPKFWHENYFSLPINYETFAWFDGAMILEIFGMASTESLHSKNIELV